MSGIASRATLLTAAVAAAVSLTALTGCSSAGGSGQAGFVTDSSGVATVKAADRTAGPKLDGETLAGKHLDLASYRGKVVVLNVWGSWCSPCRQEAPNFAKVAKDTAAEGVRFVGVNARDVLKGRAQAFERNYRVPYPSLYDPAGKLMLRFPKGTLSPKGIPCTLVLDRKGRVAARAQMPLGERDLRRMIAPVVAET